MFYLFIIFAATILIPLGVGIARYSINTGAYRYFFILIALGVLNEAGLLTLTLVGFKNNVFLLHFYSTARLIIICLFYGSLMPGHRKGILAIGCIIAVLSIVYALSGNNLYDFNSMPRAVQSIMIIVMSALYYYSMATEGDSYNPFYKGTFYLNAGMMFYFLGSFLVFTFMRVSGEPSALLSIYLTNSIVSAICNLLYTYGLWIADSSYSRA